MVDINVRVKVPAVEKLLDYMANGVGAIAGPLLAPWYASREGKARVIAAKASAEVQQIQAAAENGTSQLIAEAQAEARKDAVPTELEPDGRVQIRSEDVQKSMEFQAKKRLMNVREITSHAAEELGDLDVPDHTPDPDWTARFFDGAQDVSSEDLQKLWGKILAGEIKSPGQTSLRTLSILRNMTQKEARDFSNLMRFRINRFIFKKGLSKVLGRSLDSLTIHFSDIGLMYGFGVSQQLPINHDGQWIGEHCGRALIIEGPPGYQINMGHNAYVLTSAGQELAKVCQRELHLEYLSYFARFLTQRGYQLQLARIIDEGADGFRISDIRIIKPFERDQEETSNAE